MRNLQVHHVIFKVKMPLFKMQNLFQNWEVILFCYVIQWSMIS